MSAARASFECAQMDTDLLDDTRPVRTTETKSVSYVLMGMSMNPFLSILAVPLIDRAAMFIAPWNDPAEVPVDDGFLCWEEETADKEEDVDPFADLPPLVDENGVEKLD